MRATNRGRLTPSGVHVGSAALAERMHFHSWLGVCAVVGIMVLASAVSPARVVAGEATSILVPPVGDESPRLPGGGAVRPKSHYSPHVVSPLGNRLRGRRTGVGRPALEPVDCPVCDTLGLFDAAHFLKPTTINNQWLPLTPGTQLVLQGVANRGGGLLPHIEVFTVTDLLKPINGIPCVVTWDQDINEGQLRESELSFFAQSNLGDVWLTGEYPEEYENGEFIGAENTWIHGIEDARAGVTVQKDPIVGTPGYEEAIALENDFWDCGMVLSKTKALHGHDRSGRDDGHDGHGGHGGHDEDKSRDTLVIKEWAPLDGCDVIQIKTYAKGVGFVLVGALDDPEGETLRLTAVNHLSRAAMDTVRAAALKLDTHGYEANEHYSLTEPAFRAPKHHGDGDDDDDDLQAGGTFAESAVAPPHTFMSIGPNPFSNSTGIVYGIAQAGPVELGIFDVVGRRIRTLANQTVSPGIYRVQWDGHDDAGHGVARGVYFARLNAGAQVVRKTLVVGR